jgi:serine/threonine protein phosphatase PrpC
MVDDGEIEQILSLNLPIEDKAKRLIDMANESGGADNIAVVIVEL